MTQADLQAIKQRFGIIGMSPMLEHDIEVAVQVATTDLSVLIVGENGVGKEHFPKIIHAFSPRKHGEYYAVNCGALPAGTIESELFGHERGAYTDAKSERKGYFEIADGGTLFLDEVGELPLEMQVKLLRVLENGEFKRMGAEKIQHTNVRVVAATNMDLPRAIREGRFREDLYYRLNAVEIRVPALRERKEDIPMLFRKFATEFSERYHMPSVRLSEEATQMLKNYYWRGNVRQLKNVAERISIIETNREISAQVLATYLPQQDMETGLVLGGTHQMTGDPYMNERELLYKVLFDMKHDISELKAQLAHYKGTEPVDTSANQPAPVSVSTLQPVNTQPESAGRWSEAEEVEVEPSTMNEVEREHIRQALTWSGGNRKVAAERLGISERTLYRKIKEYEL